MGEERGTRLLFGGVAGHFWSGEGGIGGRGGVVARGCGSGFGDSWRSGEDVLGLVESFESRATRVSVLTVSYKIPQDVAEMIQQMIPAV